MIVSRSSYGHYSIMKLNGGHPSNIIMDLKPSDLTPEEQRIHSQVGSYTKDHAHKLVRYVTKMPCRRSIKFCLLWTRLLCCQIEILPNSSITAFNLCFEMDTDLAMVC